MPCLTKTDMEDLVERRMGEEEKVVALTHIESCAGCKDLRVTTEGQKDQEKKSEPQLTGAQ